MVNLMPRFATVTEWTEDVLLMFSEAISQEHLFEHWKIDHNQLFSELRAYRTLTGYADVCLQVYRCYARLSGKTDNCLIGDKNPGYSLYIPRILSLYPNARFIHLLRDYRDNHLSLVEAGMEPDSAAFTTTKWLWFERTISEQQRLRPTRFMTLRYEDLIQSPTSSLKRVCDYIGVNYRPELQNYHHNPDLRTQIMTDKRGSRLHRNITVPPDIGRIGRWQQAMKPRQICIAETLAGPTGEKYGYAVSRSRPRWLRYFAAASPGGMLAWTNIAYLRAANLLPVKARSLLLERVPVIIERVRLAIRGWRRTS